MAKSTPRSTSPARASSSTWQPVVSTRRKQARIADYCAGGKLAQFAGKDITAACAKRFVPGSEKADSVPLSVEEGKELDRYLDELKRNYQLLGTIKEKTA